MKRALLALALLAPLGAGCLGDDLTGAGADPLDLVSQPLFSVTLAEHTPIESFDGTLLDAWVFRPETDEPVPIIINFSPYWSNLAPPTADGGDAFSRHLLEYFVPRGYAIALVSARGTGLSEGCFTIGGPLELQDEEAVVEFLSTRDWSNGNVTATGKSYDGTMAQGLLTRNHPAVKTIVPVSAISELYKYNYVNGVPYGNGVVVNSFNTDYVVGTSLSQGASLYKPGAPDPQDPTYARTATRFCQESVDVQSNQYHSVLTGDYTPYWQARNYTALLPDEMDVSVFYIHGLQDWNVKPDHMTLWIEALRERGVPVKMWLGQWAHEYPTRDDWNATMLRWLDHWLKGIDTGIMDEPLVQVQDDAGAWRDNAEWPPARAQARVLHTSADGSLSATPGEGVSAYRDAPVADPLRPRAVFEVKAEEAFRISGVPTLHALVSADVPRATLSVVLSIDERVVDEGFLDLLHRDSMASGTPMESGQPYAVSLQLYPLDTLVPAGSTLRLELAHKSPGPAGAQPFPTGGVVTIHHGEGTFLTLPTLGVDDVAPEDPQPEDVGCWAC